MKPCCLAKYVVLVSQMEHYKLDWHRFNLRQKIIGMPAVTVEEFEKKTGAGKESSTLNSHRERRTEDEMIVKS